MYLRFPPLISQRNLAMTPILRIKEVARDAFRARPVQDMLTPQSSKIHRGNDGMLAWEHLPVFERVDYPQFITFC